VYYELNIIWPFKTKSRLYVPPTWTLKKLYLLTPHYIFIIQTIFEINVNYFVVARVTTIPSTPLN